VELHVTLPGEPPIALSSTHGGPWMLPWTIEAQGARWRTYLVDLPRVLAHVVPPLEEHRELLDGDAYWRDGFWQDAQAWRQLHEVLYTTAAFESLRQLPGFGDLDERFRVEDYRDDMGALERRSLSVELATKSPALVDALHWFNPIRGGQTEQEPQHVLERYEVVSRAAQRLSWLADWKAAAPDRSIAMYLAGENLYERIYEDQFYSVVPAWQHADLPGTPSIELWLARRGEVVAKVFVDPEATGAVIVTANRSEAMPPAERAHWLDGEYVHYHTTAPEYLFVDALGNAARRRVPEAFPALQQARSGVPLMRDRP
jgi:hypothetical protein